MIRTAILLAAMVCAGPAFAQGNTVWGSSSPAKPSVAKEKAPAPVAPPVAVAPPVTIDPPIQAAPPAYTPYVAPRTTQEPAPAPRGRAFGDKEPPAAVFDKSEMMKHIKDPEMRAFIEKNSNGNVIILPQNPPEMDEKTAKILPSLQESPQINQDQYPIIEYSCPDGNCDEPDDTPQKSAI